jgi:hypothetical protein
MVRIAERYGSRTGNAPSDRSIDRPERLNERVDPPSFTFPNIIPLPMGYGRH